MYQLKVEILKKHKNLSNYSRVARKNQKSRERDSIITFFWGENMRENSKFIE